jgi:hypothetical protein
MPDARDCSGRAWSLLCNPRDSCFCVDSRLFSLKDYRFLAEKTPYSQSPLRNVRY